MKNKVTAKILRRVAKKLLYRKLEVEKPYYVEVENPRERTDFLRIIEKKDLVNCKLVIDNEGNTKQIYVRPTLLV